MARPSARDLQYVQWAEGMAWQDLSLLWDTIKSGHTPGWEPGKALEFLIVRGFRQDGLEAEYPFHVPPGGPPLEQIDGLVHWHPLSFLLECKDEDSVDTVAIAKLRAQLLRRPETTLGCVFTTGTFSRSAVVLEDLSVPHRILLWQGLDIENSVRGRSFASTLRAKYRHLCQYGIGSYSPYYRRVEEP